MDLIEVRETRIARRRDDLTFGAHEVALGGGSWLFSEPQPGIHGLVDLTGLGWEPIVESPDGGLEIAATCTLAELRRMPRHPVRPADALFAPAVDALLGSWKVHNVATVGGNVCLALPAGPMTSLTAALDGVAVIWMPGGGERRLPVTEFVLGVRRTALRPGEVLRAIELPAVALAARVAMRRIALSELGRSAAFVIARVDAGGEFVVTITAATPRPYQLRFARMPGDRELAHAVSAIDDWHDDAHGAPDWRRAMTLRFAEELRNELTTRSVARDGATP